MSLGLECAVCQRRDRPAYALCHHCGKPLCDEREHCAFELADPAFSALDGPVRAVHCKACWQRHHPRLRPLRLY